MSSFLIKLKFNKNERNIFYFWVSNAMKNSSLDNIRPKKNQESNKIWRCATSLNEFKNVLRHTIFKSRNT